MSSTWIETASGKHFDVFAIDPALLDLRDIAAGLSNCCRFAGQIPRHYSVAQHSVIMTAICSSQREALMHDAAEAYMGDVPAPIKRALPDFNAAMHSLEAAIADAFDLVYPWPEDVEDADRRMVLTEGRAFGRDIASWGIDSEPYPGELPDVWVPEYARERFLANAVNLGLRNKYEVPRA